MRPVYLNLFRPECELPENASHFWGNPSLPVGVDFPTFKDEDGDEVPYVFICQINLRELGGFEPENPLPHSGLLSFFAKIDHFMGDYDAPAEMGGSVSDEDAVKVIYSPEGVDYREIVVVDDDDEEISPEALGVTFSSETDLDDHALFARPTHREWADWDHPFEGWEILLQVDSFEGEDFDLNFMDVGVLDFIISPEDLRRGRFDRVRGIVLST